MLEQGTKTCNMNKSCQVLQKSPIWNKKSYVKITAPTAQAYYQSYLGGLLKSVSLTPPPTV